jgi:hypothetical protein
MKVIGFRPNKDTAAIVEKYEKAITELGFDRSELAREAFAAGLELAIKTIAERRRQEAIHTLKKLKITRITTANPLPC